MAADGAYKVFGDIAVPDAAELALRRVLSAYRICDARVADWKWQLEQVVGNDPGTEYPGKRIWYRNVSDNHGVIGYISTVPPEFRPTAPAGPDDVILDPPPVDNIPRLSARLYWTLKASQSPAWPQTATLKALQEVVYDVLDVDSRTYDPGAAPVPEGIQFFAKVAAQAGSPGIELPKQIAALYEACLFEARLSTTTFSACMTLLQLQAMLNLWIEQPGAFESPWQRLSDAIQMLGESDHKLRMVEVLAALGNGSYTHATEAVKNALNCYSLTQTNRNLVLGCNHFFSAMLVAKLNDLFHLEAKLTYTEVLAEEGFVCTNSGLSGGVYFFLQSPVVTIDSIVGQLASGDAPPTIVNRLSSIVTPVFHKWFARSLVAAAQTRSPGPDFDAGLALLHKLETELQSHPDAKGRFEEGWIDYLLLLASQAANDQESAGTYASRIATRLTLIAASSEQAAGAPGA
jgi:hypothetical protein